LVQGNAHRWEGCGRARLTGGRADVFRARLAGGRDIYVQSKAHRCGKCLQVGQGSQVGGMCAGQGSIAIHASCRHVLMALIHVDEKISLKRNSRTFLEANRGELYHCILAALSRAHQGWGDQHMLRLRRMIAIGRPMARACTSTPIR
jgi:hypothetical protein